MTSASQATQGQHHIAALLNAQSRGHHEGRRAQRESEAFQNQGVRPRQSMAHEPKATPSLAGAEDPTGKMPPRANRDAPIMTVDLVDAGLDAFSLGQRL